MARLEMMGDGACADFSISGTMVSVGNVNVDCAVWQSDHEMIVDICSDDNGGFVAGASNGKAYVLSCIIPPRRYELVEDGEDENGPIMKQVAIPLNPNDVVVKVWPYAG